MDQLMVMKMEFPKKKPNRLPDYDYSQDGAYFITICTKDRQHLLSRIAVGTTIGRPYGWQNPAADERLVTKQAKQPVWQSRYYDHVIRDDYDYQIKYQYIDENPANWLLRKDEYT